MRIDINFDSYLELEKISDGSFAPLNGFMTEEDFYSVCDNMRLSNGLLFPLPVVLPITKIEYKKIKLNEKVSLFHNEKLVGEILSKSVFKPNLNNCIKLLFGTNDKNHPGIQNFISMKPYFLGGPVNNFYNFKHKYSKFYISPKKNIQLIKKKGIKSIAGFQTRNVPHRAHEYILLSALKIVEGLFIQPLIGKKKIGDFRPEIVIDSYDYLIEKVYNNNNIILGSLTTYMRYAGPREAVFHALIRKNFGCTHFLVGRDHAGVGNYYGLYEAQKLCEDFEKELKIKIIKVRGPFYCNKCKKITTDKYCNELKYRKEISGSNIRKALLNNLNISDIFMRKEIVNLIRRQDIFID